MENKFYVVHEFLFCIYLFQVENLRADTLKVEAERDDILTTLDTLSNSQLVHNLEGIDLDEVDRYIKRLAKRSAAVHVEITSERSTFQQESLQSVNSLIDALIKEVKCDAKLARRRCVAYLNSCSDSPEGMAEEHNAIGKYSQIREAYVLFQFVSRLH